MTRLAFVLAGLLMLAACASGPAPREFTPPVYPPPPDEPRFVYERTLLYNSDVEIYSRGMRFRDFAVGGSRKLKGLVKPFDVAAHRGRVYVSDSVQRAVMVFDIPAHRFFEIGNEKPGRLAKPLGLDVAADGTLYVADISAQRIMVYDADGAFLRSIGDDTQLQRPSGVTISKDGDTLYVVDTGGVESETHTIHVYDSVTGEYRGNIGTRGPEDGNFNLPLQAATGRNGTLHVVDSGNFRVQTFDADGRFVSSFGSVGRFPGQFARPRGIATDLDGNIYVVDTAFGNFQIFNAEGQLLMFIGQRGHSGHPGSFMLPAGIDVDEDGRIYVVDQFFRKVDVFRPIGLGPAEGRAVPTM
jgi:DNA-binding beta-propeller fold protein YncE